MASLRARLVSGLDALRRRRPVVDHAVRMQQHYGKVDAGQQAGAITYFAFLSFFPILALAFFVVGLLAHVYPAARHDLVKAIGQVLPGLVGGRHGISLRQVQQAAATVGLLGLAGVVYSGLGWLSAVREALIVVFELPRREQPNFVIGKLRDLLTLALVGTVLLVSVSVSGFVSGFSTQLLDLVGLATQLAPLLELVTIVLGVAANVVLFFALFRLLAEPRTPARSLWQGALLGALGFEVLKRLSGVLLASTERQPAFQAFGIALILVVWINYFSRLVLYSAAWAHTSDSATALRVAEPPAPLQGPPSPPLGEEPGPAVAAGRPWVTPVVAGGALLALAALARRITTDR